MEQQKQYCNKPDGSICVEKELRVQTGFAPYQCRLFNELNDYYNLIIDDVMNKRELELILLDLTPRYQDGQKMLKIAKLKKLTFLDDDTCSIQLDFEKGIVYVLNFWSYDPNYDDTTTENLHQVLQQNPQWKGKVRLIDINHDDNSTDIVVQGIKSLKWKQFEHYKTYNLDQNNQILINRLGSGKKFVNKQGQYFDFSLETNEGLVEKINELIAENDEPEKKKQKLTYLQPIKLQKQNVKNQKNN